LFQGWSTAEALGIEQRKVKMQAERYAAKKQLAEREPKPKRQQTRTFNGKALTLKQWSQETGIGVPTIKYRLKRGWTVEQALTIPAKDPSLYCPDKRMLSHDGETHSVTEWSRKLGIGIGTINYRLKSGWTVADALTKPSRRAHRGVGSNLGPFEWDRCGSVAQDRTNLEIPHYEATQEPKPATLQDLQIARGELKRVAPHETPGDANASVRAS
jgi:hypothetical protein